MVLVTGGATVLGDSELSSAELFDGTSSFIATGFMGTARENHTATLLTSGINAGKVLIVGGDYNGDDAGIVPIQSAELFDGTSSFAATGATATARTNHTATLLPSGEVLVAGGENGVNSPLSSAELFLVASGGTCAADVDCSSGICDEGVCCAAQCANGGVCQRCSADAGACLAVTNGPDPATCADASTCNAGGQCVPVVVEGVDAGEDGGAPPIAMTSCDAGDDCGASPGVSPSSDDAGVSPSDDDAGTSTRTPQAKVSSSGGGGCSSTPASPARGGAATALFLLACAASLRARRRSKRHRIMPLRP
jgi:hypothetical protein